MSPQQLPDAKVTGDFLLQGGSFALLCILVLFASAASYYAGRALFALLREFLGKTSTQLETQTQILGKTSTQLETQTQLLDGIHQEQKVARERAEATADQLNPWGTPDWLVKRLDTLDRRAEEIKEQVSRLRLDLATAPKTTN